MIPNRPKLLLPYRYEDCPGGWKTLLALVWTSETRPLTGPKRVLVPRTRAGHGSGFGLFPRSAASVFSYSFLNLGFCTSSPLQGLASIASAWEFFFLHCLSLNGSEYRQGHGALGIGYSFLHQPPTTGSNQLAHIWVHWEQDAWHGTHGKGICIQHGIAWMGFIALL